MRRTITLEDARPFLERLVIEVEEFTGLHSNWNGEIALSEDISVGGSPSYIAVKEWQCAIRINMAAIDEASLPGTLIHEVVHSVSAGLSTTTFRQNVGFEEGVAEMVTRLIMPHALERLGIDSGPPREKFLDFVAALEELRRLSGQE